jgi:hypothetical protein
MKKNLSLWNHEYNFIDFDFVELRFASVLRLPRPHGERRTEPRLRGSSAQPKSIYSPWGWGK